MVNRKVVAGVVIAAAVIAAGVFVSKRLSAASAGAGKTQYKLAKVEVGQVKKTVSSSGVLQAWRVVDIKARAGGELSKLMVDVGSQVVAGQVIAEIDPLDVQLALNQAKADEASALARRAQSEKTWQLQVIQSQIAVRDAAASLKSAEANLAAAKARLATARMQAETQPELTRAAIANAQASYDQAVQQRQQLDSTIPQQRAAAKAAYDQAVANQNNAMLQVERQKALVAKGFVSQQAVDTAEATLQVNTAQVSSAKARLDTIEAELRTTAEAADARVQQTKAALEQAKAQQMEIGNRKNAAQESEAAFHQAEAAVLRARVALDQARANVRNNEIRRFDIMTNAASIARAQASVQNSQTSLQRTIIKAPMDGVVLQKYVEQGTIIASALGMSSQGQNIVQLGDVSRMFVDVSVDETDIASVDDGQKVDVTIEAYPGVPFEGRVTRIDPQTKVEQNVTSVHVRVEIDNTAPTFRLLKPGMNATCEFVIDKKENVVKVPSEAVRDDDNGKFVERGVGGVPAPPDPKTGTPADADALVDVKLTKVRLAAEDIGLEGNESIEIKKGLKEGDAIVVQTIEPTPTTPGSGSPFGGGFGRGMGGGGRR